MNSKRQLDPNPLRPMFTLRFLQALARINNLHRPSSSSSSLRWRCRKIKRASDVAAAAATGAKRAWSQAVLRNVQRQSRRRAMARAWRKKRLGLGANQRSQSHADKLRRIVPGGQTMDFCSLLEETADYIQSLTTQVHEMQALADSLNL